MHDRMWLLHVMQVAEKKTVAKPAKKRKEPVKLTSTHLALALLTAS